MSVLRLLYTNKLSNTHQRDVALAAILLAAILLAPARPFADPHSVGEVARQFLAVVCLTKNVVFVN